MGQPKKQSSPRKTGLRRSHLRLELARRVNAKSPVKVRTTTRETGKALAKKAVLTQPDEASAVKKSTKKAAATTA